MVKSKDWADSTGDEIANEINSARNEMITVITHGGRGSAKTALLDEMFKLLGTDAAEELTPADVIDAPGFQKIERRYLIDDEVHYLKPINDTRKSWQNKWEQKFSGGKRK